MATKELKSTLNKEIYIILIIGATAIVLGLFVLQYQYPLFLKSCWKYDCGDGYQLLINVKQTLPGNYHLYCKIKKDNEICIPSRLFKTVYMKSFYNYFEMITSHDKRCVGIVSQGKTEPVWLIFDKKTETLWIRNQDDEVKDFYSLVEELENNKTD